MHMLNLKDFFPFHFVLHLFLFIFKDISKSFLLSIVILFVKDAAVLSGHVVGRLDRLLRPRWRRMTRSYLESGRGAVV